MARTKCLAFQVRRMLVRRLWITRNGDGTPGLPPGRLVFSFVTSGHFEEAHRSLSLVLVSFTRGFLLSSLSSSCSAWSCLRKKIRREKKRRKEEEIEARCRLKQLLGLQQTRWYWANYTCKHGSKASVDQHSDYLRKQHVISFQVRYKYTMQRQHIRQKDRSNKVKDNIQNTC
jgi:hypothetical protein